VSGRIIALFHRFSALLAGFIAGTGNFWSGDMVAQAEIEDEWQSTTAQGGSEIRQNVIGLFWPIKQI
jgi:hypothetical protein